MLGVTSGVKLDKKLGVKFRLNLRAVSVRFWLHLFSKGVFWLHLFSKGVFWLHLFSKGVFII